METNPDLIALINSAAQGHQWVLLAVAGLALLVPVVLHALGKDIPVVSAVLNALVDVVKGMKIVQPAPKDPKAQPGIASVVKIEDARKPEEKK